MRLFRAAIPAFALACLAAFISSACGSTEGSNVNGSGAQNGSGNAPGNGSGNSSSGGSLNLGGPGLGLGGDAAPGEAGAGALPQECAGTLIKAERIPLDMYIMLDVSGSMLQPTLGDPNVTKWDAVSSALSDFFGDPNSDGMGVGLQVFPIVNAQAPTSCTSDQQCGAYGPCINRGCWPLINGQVDTCFDASDCANGQDCVVIGECANDNNYVCDHDATATCGANRGACTVPPSVCLSADDCRVDTYATPAAPIAALPDARDGLLQVIAGSTPDEGALTPTGPALGGALQQARDWATAHTDHQVVAVLATDGLPTLKTSGMVCDIVSQLADIQDVVDLAGTGQAGDPSISTFVIGVLGPDDVTLGAADILDAIATSGGTDSAFIVDTSGNVQTEFQSALNQIREAGLSCDLLVPKPETGKTVDYDQVNVVFDSGSGKQTVPRVLAGADGCDASGGWYYDVDPATTTPTKILTCPATCDAFQKTDMGSVQIALGCKTIVK